jgi:hypothetical protein
MESWIWDAACSIRGAKDRKKAAHRMQCGTDLDGNDKRRKTGRKPMFRLL